MHKEDSETGMVEISIVEKDGRLCCSIEDNGVGREKARELTERSVLKTKSMGMNITEERLRLLSNQGWEKLINIVDLKDSFDNALGTRVEIIFPTV
jgi:LytS/YehU family sensor histidine kinase